MTISMVFIKDGNRSDSMPICSSRYVHHLRAILVLLFAHALLSKPGQKDSSPEDLLNWITGLHSVGVDPDGDYSIVDVERALSSQALLTIDYDFLPEDPVRIAGLEFGSKAGNAAVGLWKFVNSADDEGYFSIGDVADIAQFFDYLFVGELPLAAGPSEEDVSRLQKLWSVFRSAARHQEAILYL